MPERGFNTEFWTDPFVFRLPLEAKVLYTYLWTNSRCNQAGLYQIAIETISSETKLNVNDIPNLIQMLEPKVKWYPEQDLIWVKNFIKHQAKSPKFLIAAASRLKDINDNGVVKELLEYNLRKYSICIPYAYSMNTVCILDSDTSASANTSTGSNTEGGVVKGGIEVMKAREKKGDIYVHFERFWKAYPKKVDKGHAEIAFKKINPSKELVDIMITAIDRQKAEKEQATGFMPEWKNPATWLRGQCWEDEISEVKSGTVRKSPRPGAPGYKYEDPD